MPGQFQLSIDLISAEVREIADVGLPGVILFGIPKWKDIAGSAASRDDGVVQQAIQKIKAASPDLLVITDLCFCEYTDHGHCGVLVDRGGRSGVDNDAPLEMLSVQGVSPAKAGADGISPRGLLDGTVSAHRTRLDAAGFSPGPALGHAAQCT